MIAVVVLLATLTTSALGRSARRSPRLVPAELIGASVVLPTVDREAAGRAEAFPAAAGRSGTARAVSLYVDRATRAAVVRVAVYADGGGGPGRLLATGARRLPAAGWDRITIAPIRLAAGRRYWIGVLAAGGTLAYRDRTEPGCRSVESAQPRLAAFPRQWRSGASWPTCALSAYVSGVAIAPSATPAGRVAHCVVRPSACGYPDATNTGVPAGVRLRPSTSIVITTPGAVVSGLDVHGTVYVNADHVTIRDTRVTTAWPAGYAIHIDSGASGTVIEDSTIRGRDSGPGSVEYAVQNSGSGTRAVRLQMTDCTECFAGAGLLKDSYANVTASVPGAHYEDIYDGGGDQPLTVEHDTLLNPHDQTAVVFGGTDFGPEQHLTIDGSLLAGGGYMIYGGSNSPATRDVVVTGNRFARSYFAHGGYFGAAGYMNWSVTTWRDNYWDDTLAAAPGR